MRIPLFPKGKDQIIDEVGKEIGTIKNKDERAYVIKAVNSYDKLVEYARHKKDCRKGYLSRETEVCTCGFEQVLKEAEKP